MAPLSRNSLLSKATRTVDINNCVIFLFMEVFTGKEFKSAFSLASQSVGDVLRWLVTILIAAAIENCSAADQKFGLMHKGAAFISLIGAVENDVLNELGTQQVS